MKTHFLICDGVVQIILTPESQIETMAVQCIPKGEVREACVSTINFSESSSGILRDVSKVNSLIIKLN